MTIAFVHPREGLASYPGGKLYFYDPGTTTARNVFQDAGLTSLHAQPVIANASGAFPTIYLQTGTFKVRMETAANVLVYEQDDVDPGVSTGPGALPINSGGTGAKTPVQARANLGAAASSDLTSAQNSILIMQSQISGSLAAGNTRLGSLAGRDTVRAIDLDDTDFGQLVAQHSLDLILGQQTTTSIIPNDGTIPQIGEGFELWSKSFTPKFSSSRIIVRGNFNVGGNTGQVTAFTLFDGGSSALAVAAISPSATNIAGVALNCQINSWGTTAKTLSIRFGPSTGTGILNGNGSGPNYGIGVSSSVELYEIKGGPF